MKSFVVLGVGRFGKSVAKTLYELGNEVLAIDNDETAISEIAPNVTHAVIGDCSDEAVLKSLGVRNFDVAIIAMGGSLETSIMTTLLVKDMGIKFILAKCSNSIHGKVLKKVGANKVVLPEQDMGIKIARSLVDKNILDYIELSSDHSIVELTVPFDWIGKNMKTLNVRANYGINVMAVKTRTGIEISPSGDRPFNKDDILVVVGKNVDIEKFS